MALIQRYADGSMVTAISHKLHSIGTGGPTGTTPLLSCTCPHLLSGLLTPDIDPWSVILRPTEIKGQFYFILGGRLDSSELVADHEKLLLAMHDFIKRDDIKIGKVKYAVEYRSAVSVYPHRFRGLIGL